MLWIFGSESGVEPGDTVEAVCTECGLIRPCIEVVQTTGFSVLFVTLSENKKVSGYVCQECGTHFETSGEINIDLLTQILEALAKDGNEAKQIAQNKANSPEIRLSQLRIARDKMAELEQMTVVYSGIKITSFDEFMRDLAEIEADIAKSKYSDDEVISECAEIKSDAVKSKYKVGKGIIPNGSTFDEPRWSCRACHHRWRYPCLVKTQPASKGRK